MRIAELEYALMEHQIENRKSTVIGYDEAQAYLWAVFSDLERAWVREAETKHDNDDEINRYSINLWQEILYDAMDLLYVQTD